MSSAFEHLSMTENVNLSRQDPLEDQHAVLCNVKNSAEFTEDDNSSFNLSPLDLDLGRLTSKIPLIVDVKQPKVSPRCSHTKKSCPCGKLDFQDYIGFVKAIQILAPVFIDSDTRTTQSGFIFKSLKQHRKTRSIGNLSDLLTEFSPVVQSGDSILSPEARWIFDSIEATLKRRALIKSSLFVQPVTADALMKGVNSRQASARDRKTSEFMTSPKKFRVFSVEPEAVAVPFGRQISEAKFSRQSLLSCSSTNPGSSYCSTSSTHCFGTSAFIYCVWKNKIPYFVFSVDDDRGNVYVASPLKIKSSSSKGLDYIYLFQSLSNGRRESKNHVVGTSDVIGKMKVSSSVFLNSERSKVMESEFVLFAPYEEHSTQTQRPFSNVTKANGFSRKVADIFRSIHSWKNNPDQKLRKSTSPMEDMRQLFAVGLDIFDETCQANNLEHDFSTNFELATIVVKDYGYDSIKRSTVGGWGLRFLEKGQVDDADYCKKNPSSSRSCQESSTRSDGKSARDVNVLVPAGFHGGPVARSGGPSSLTERWRSNGHCDCGGWDVGCSLKVLKNDLDSSKVSPQMEAKEECKSLELFIEGARQVEPTVKLLNLTEDVYAIYFQPTLSALQAFSVGVAIIHSQTPDLYPDI